MAKSHVEQVAEFLQQHTFNGMEARHYAVVDLAIDWQWYPGDLKGTFYLELDGVKFPEAFRFSFGCTPQVELQLPMFFSPLGAPASFPRIDLPKDVIGQMSSEIGRILPPVRGILWDHPRDAPITFRMAADLDALAWQQTFNPPQRIKLNYRIM